MTGRPRSVPWRLLALAALLAAGLGAERLAERAWGSVVGYASPYSIADARGPGTPPLSERVVLVLVDGLRLDASRNMDFLNRLRERGADLDSRAGAPSYSRPGRATLVTGAWAEVHGATSNFHDRAIATDNLFRRAAVAGRSIAVAGSQWPSLFGPDLRRAGAAIAPPPVQDVAGRYAELEPLIRAFGAQAAAFLAEHPAQLSVADMLITDYAAHEFGASSDEYRLAVQRTDAMLEQLVGGLDLAATSVVVTSDHGHLDTGGHGGPEPEVVATPLVLAGRGVRAGVRSVAEQVDVAPTLAALLGLPPPSASAGRVLVETLDLTPEARLVLLAAQWRQQRELAGALLSFLDGAAPELPEAPAADEAALLASLHGLEHRVEAARERRLAAERRSRLPRALLVLLLPLPLLVHAVRSAPRTALGGVVAGVIGYALAFRFLVYGRGVRLALSAINHEEDVAPYFQSILLLAAAAIVVSVLAAWALTLRGAGAGQLVDVGLGVAAVVVFLLAAGVALVDWRQGLIMEWRQADLGSGFLGFVALVQIQGVALASLALPVLAWVAARLPRRAVAAGLGLWLVAVPLAAQDAGSPAASPQPTARPAPAPSPRASPRPAPSLAERIHEDVPEQISPRGFYLIYLHGRILELQGRDAVSPQHGRYEYDAILRALAGRGFHVISELRGPDTGVAYAKRVAGQVRRLLAGGAQPGRVLVVGFSKGGFLALATAAELRRADLHYAILAGCGPDAPDFAPRLAGRFLSLYDATDGFAGSCADTFARAPGLATRELELRVGKGHGTFFVPRMAWLEPVVLFAQDRLK